MGFVALALIAVIYSGRLVRRASLIADAHQR